MANLDYCRFHNTVLELQDCYNHLDDPTHTAASSDHCHASGKLSEDETAARKRLIALCRVITNEYGNFED